MYRVNRRQDIEKSGVRIALDIKAPLGERQPREHLRRDKRRTKYRCNHKPLLRERLVITFDSCFPKMVGETADNNDLRVFIGTLWFIFILEIDLMALLIFIVLFQAKTTGSHTAPVC